MGPKRATRSFGDALEPVTVERVDGGKLRCTGATWTDAVVIFPGEVLAFQNIERQAHALRAPAPGTVVETPPAAAPDPGEDDFEGGKNEPSLSSAPTAASRARGGPGAMPFGAPHSRSRGCRVLKLKGYRCLVPSLYVPFEQLSPGRSWQSGFFSW